MSYDIEKGIPVPTRRAANSKYPFDMCNDVGDSFLVTTDEPSKRVAGIRAASKRNYERTGKKFVVRQVNEGVRVWRVE